MKPSQALRLAAKCVSGSTYASCLSLYLVMPDHIDRLKFHRQCMAYLKQCARAKQPRSDSYWFGEPWITEYQNHRVLALCLAAAIAESDGN